MEFLICLIKLKFLILFQLLFLISSGQEVKSELTCLGCVPNFYFDQNIEVCRKCPNNTITIEINASSVNDCVCTKGFENKTLEKCSECEVGFYQDKRGNFSCIQCSSNSLTLDVASTSESECRCEPGFTPQLETQAVSRRLLSTEMCDPTYDRWQNCIVDGNFNPSGCQCFDKPDVDGHKWIHPNILMSCEEMYNSASLSYLQQSQMKQVFCDEPTTMHCCFCEGLQYWRYPTGDELLGIPLTVTSGAIRFIEIYPPLLKPDSIAMKQFLDCSQETVNDGVNLCRAGDLRLGWCDESNAKNVFPRIQTTVLKYGMVTTLPSNFYKTTYDYNSVYDNINHDGSCQLIQNSISNCLCKGWEVKSEGSGGYSYYSDYDNYGGYDYSMDLEDIFYEDNPWAKLPCFNKESWTHPVEGKTCQQASNDLIQSHANCDSEYAENCCECHGRDADGIYYPKSPYNAKYFPSDCPIPPISAFFKRLKPKLAMTVAEFDLQRDSFIDAMSIVLGVAPVRVKIISVTTTSRRRMLLSSEIEVEIEVSFQSEDDVTSFENVIENPDLMTNTLDDNGFTATNFNDMEVSETSTVSVLQSPTSVDGENNVDYATCVPCAAGKFKPTLSDVACSDCPVNFYCPEQSVNPLTCVSNSTSTLNSQKVEDCHCNAGFHYVSSSDVEAYHCDLCEPGSFTDDINNQECTLCPAGFWSDLYGTTQCFICPLNSYCPEGSVLPIACPENSVSVQYSSVITDCHCNPGYHYNLEQTNTSENSVTYECVACAPGFYNELFNQEVCIECPADTYNTHYASNLSSNCLRCTANSSSQVSSDELQDCLCDLGFSGNPGEECNECEPGFFRSNSSEYICTACPSNTYNVDYASDSDVYCTACDSDKVSGIGSRRELQCVCKPGLFATLHESGTKWTCTSCPVGSFSEFINTTECSLCPIGKFSNAISATSSDTCTVCADGSYAVLAGQSECSECGPGTWQNVRLENYQQFECELCPLNSTNINYGSYDINDCTCDATFEKKCTQYDSSNQGVCIMFECVPCEKNHFCAGSNAKEACPENSITPISSGAVTDCVCNVSYYGSDGGPCLPCEQNFYCPGGENQVSCMPFSSSDTLSSNIEDCICNPSYYSISPGQSCQKCPPGYYCEGGTHRSQCANNSDSRSGSNTISACICDPGYWRGCILTQDGTYLDAEGEVCDTNWHMSCILCGENNVCVNNSLLHCPHDSSAPIGTHDAHACVCNNGYYKVHDDGEFVSFSWADSEQVIEMTMTLDVTLAEFDTQMQEDYKDSIAEASGVESDSVEIVSVTEVQTRRRLLSSGIEVKTEITGIKTVMEELVLEHEKLLGNIQNKMKAKGLNFNAVYKTTPLLKQPSSEETCSVADRQLSCEEAAQFNLRGFYGQSCWKCYMENEESRCAGCHDVFIFELQNLCDMGSTGACNDVAIMLQCADCTKKASTTSSPPPPSVEIASIIGIPGPITDGNPLTMTYRKSSTGPASADGFKGYLGNKILIGSDVVPIGTPTTYYDYELNTATVNIAQDITGRVAVYDWANSPPADGGGAWGSNCGFTFTAYVAQKYGATGLLMLGNPKNGLSTDLKLQCENQALLNAVSIPTFHGKIFEDGNQVYGTDQASRLQERMTTAGPDNLAFEVTDATNELTSTGGSALIGETKAQSS